MDDACIVTVCTEKPDEPKKEIPCFCFEKNKGAGF
jgi:hypothetical protein